MSTDTQPAKTYVGHRDARGEALIEVRADGEKIGRPLRHLVRHSPTGFEWGYGGSGPADTARSILADHLGHPVPPAVYQRFKAAVVQNLAKEWHLASQQIDQALTTIRQDMQIECLRCGDSGFVWKSEDPDLAEDGYCSCSLGDAARRDCEGDA